MTDDSRPSDATVSSSEACRLGLWMSSLDEDANESRDPAADPTSPAERLRRLEAFSAG